MSVTLPLEMANMVRAPVESGDYASESEVIREGLRSLAARERAVGAWLRDQVVHANDRLAADPPTSMSPDQVQAHVTQPTDR